MKLTVLIPGSSFPRLRSAVTLLRSEGLHILVDSGLAEDGGRLLAALDRVGVEPREVDVVVATHLHYDHCGNHLLFPRARYLVGADDLADVRGFMAFFHADGSPGKMATADLLRSSHEEIKPFYVRSIVREVTRNLAFYDLVLAGDPRFVPLGPPYWLTSEVEIVSTAGHTQGHRSVVAHGVELEDGGAADVLIAGDAVPGGEVVERASAEEVPLVADSALYWQTRRSLLDRYRYIIPGHGASISNGGRLAEGARS